MSDNPPTEHGSQRQRDSSLLDLHISKAAESLYEAGKVSSKSFIGTLAFLSLGSILAFGSVDSDTTILGLSLPRLQGAQVAIVLTAAALYRTLTSLLVERVVFSELRRLMRAKESTSEPEWFYYYPSLMASTQVYGHWSRVGSLARFAPKFALTTAFLITIVVLYQVGDEAKWDMMVLLTTSISLILMTLAVLVLLEIRGHQKVEAAAVAIGPIQAPPSSSIPAPVINYLVTERRWRLEETYVYRGKQTVSVPKGFLFDLSTVPRLFWWVLAPFYLTVVGPLVHQYLYVNGGRTSKEQLLTRSESDRLFRKQVGRITRRHN